MNIGRMLASCAVMWMYVLAVLRNAELTQTTRLHNGSGQKVRLDHHLWGYSADTNDLLRTLALPVELNGAVSNAIPF